MNIFIKILKSDLANLSELEDQMKARSEGVQEEGDNALIYSHSSIEIILFFIAQLNQANIYYQVLYSWQPPHTFPELTDKRK